MNLALSAIIILLLLLPAFSFRIGVSLLLFTRNKGAVKKEDLEHDLVAKNVSRAMSKLNFTETIFLFSVVPLLLHMLSLLLIKWAGMQIRFDLLLNIFSGKDDVILADQNVLFNGRLLSFLLYSFIETICGLAIGMILSAWLSNKKWVLRTLTGNSSWYRLSMASSLTDDQKKNLDFVVVQVLTQTKEGSIIYMGYLRSFDLGTDHQLLQITLSSAKRMDLRLEQVTRHARTPGTETRLHFSEAYGPLIEIPGDGFTILGKEIQNVNVQYMKKSISLVTQAEVLVPVL